MAKLTPKQDRFVAEYLIDLNATQAAIRAGYSLKTAHVTGHDTLKKPEVAAAIQEAQTKRGEKLEVTAEWVLQRWIDIATADPNELIQYRRGPCKHCWERWGGLPEGEPRPEPNCQSCHGEGQGGVFVHDTRKLKGAAKRLYAGVKLGKDGLQVLMRDQDSALLNIARHLGMFTERVEHSGSLTVIPEQMTEEQIVARLAAIKAKRGGSAPG